MYHLPNHIYLRLLGVLTEIRAVTLFSEQEGVESQVIGGEVDPALTRHSPFPAAAGVMSHQFFFQWKAKSLLESHHCLTETGWVIFQCRLAN